MPVRDGTGPQGAGSRSGRGMGSCKPGMKNTSPAFTSGDRRSLGWEGRLWNTARGWFGWGRRRRGRTGNTN
ncbi:MAG: DUF5320 domain-containing protein [Anaerolineaceae bacterium]|nr:DUF5320 domain-containing protein [Anaerolineaceae bacterium]